MSHVPLTVSDLREIAKNLAEWERLLVKKGTDEYTDRARLVRSIEIERPDSDGEVIGKFILTDGWVGFIPDIESSWY